MEEEEGVEIEEEVEEEEKREEEEEVEEEGKEEEEVGEVQAEIMGCHAIFWVSLDNSSPFSTKEG